MDSSSYHKSKSSKDAEEDAMLGGNEFHVDKETFEDCEKFVFHCPDPNCGQEIIMEGPFRGAVSNDTFQHLAILFLSEMFNVPTS